ncbi:Wzy polymerase domain-containing protein [Rhodoferax sp.]|uniref:Wzy polymerase domain-containing protein n=1 Tax=Rhodoferax sp. TaxID=50421 RepID=UPI00283C6F8C|nr:Wzy polymerase domain-containing protein [Rhodoferax sp.]MDR3371642.1 Wzy polymerase domain-containing protein [Rhodoferax sp.]
MPAIATFILLTLPWLNPFSPGPTSQAMPLLFAWVCTAGVLLAFAFDRQRGENTQMVRAIVLAWAVAAGLSAAIGLLQYFDATAVFGQWVDHTELGQAFGNLRQRNQFATLLNSGLVAVLWLAVDLPGAYAAAVVAAVLLGAGNAVSSSRTGLLQLALILLLTLWWQRRSAGRQTDQARRVQAVLLAALAAYAVALFALPLLAGLDPLTSGAWARLRAGDAVCSSRLTLWGNVLHLIVQKPWSGWGWGELDYAHFITLYPGNRFCDILDNAHDLPLHLAVELGVPVALVVCGVALWLVWRGQPWRERNPTRQLAWGVLAVILLHSLLEYPLWYGPFQTAALLSVWLLWWVPRRGDLSSSCKKFWPLALYFYALSALLIVAICGFAAWNYHLVSQVYLEPAQRAPAYRDHTLDKLKSVWMYQDQVRFAELTTADLTPANAAYLNALAKEMLHFSPEARVVEVLLDSARLLGRKDEVAFYAARYKAAFPKDYAAWAGAASGASARP